MLMVCPSSPFLFGCPGLDYRGPRAAVFFSCRLGFPGFLCCAAADDLVTIKGVQYAVSLPKDGSRSESLRFFVPILEFFCGKLVPCRRIAYHVFFRRPLSRFAVCSMMENMLLAVAPS